VIYGATALAFWAVNGIERSSNNRVMWSRYTLWWSFVAIYASMAFIAALCTYVRVLPKLKPTATAATAPAPPTP
jgi:hypothetical protein